MSYQNKQVKILLPLALPKVLAYAVPYDIEIEIGDFVEVPLGSKKCKGVVWQDISDAEKIPEGKIKTIIRKINIPPLKKELIKFVDWVASYTLSQVGNVLKMVISGAGEIEERDLRIKAFQINKEKLQYAKLTVSRKRIIDVLNQKSPLTKKEILEASQTGNSVFDGLLESGLLEEIFLNPQPVKISAPKLDVEFSPEQVEAVKTLQQSARNNCYSVNVLDGVTGSGKTEVYFSAIEEILKQDGTQVLIMLPEIALTTQITSRFKKRFGFNPVEWHSGMSPKQKEKSWSDLAIGNARLVIGARSALFLPYNNLKLIVVDEEHDQSYKQEEGVIYQARDMAVVRAKIENIPIILASATPSIETIENVRSGKYSHLAIPSRYAGAQMPHSEVVDMRQQKLLRGEWISLPLCKAIQENIERGKQSLLFLNRRGYAPLTLCGNCGYRFQCPSCTSWLVEHKSSGNLLCHHCGHSQKLSKQCPECDKEDSLVACGPGVERIAEEVGKKFPTARIGVMTSDSTTSLGTVKDLVEKIENNEIDIIVGTQMIAKGYHFPNLTLVGIIDADIGLAGGDLRASERTYQLLHQVSGRAGREKDKGKVIVQSYIPDNMVIKAILSGQRKNFLEFEAQSRSNSLMPPYSRFAGIIISGRDEQQTSMVARDIVKSAPTNDNIRILGPVPAPMYLLRGRYRQRILIKAPLNINIQSFLRKIISIQKPYSDIKIKVDVDPYSFV